MKSDPGLAGEGTTGTACAVAGAAWAVAGTGGDVDGTMLVSGSAVATWLAAVPEK